MWKFKEFDRLTTLELFKIYKLRVNTFVVEQQCAYPEIDDKDLQSIHIFDWENDDVLNYARLIIDEPVHIGRVIVAPAQRGSGAGRILMEKVMNYIETHHSHTPLHLQGQAHLHDFYASYGFKAVSDIYFEDMIPHIDMERPAFKAADQF
ncbi:GNAT family N-acetyltransferase [Macrococcus equipercicus]|uniref:GNAT family N-acetyltransferase n=1 Tax=Macrococcus equipercicus TaxID=69967 RepID=A0A9Q9F1R3_9STAP|nr:GNAT family N-acetyltransferase [Macrococcus equipercicus]UTH14232.1 GNAT family N-acetyltransferase [Macrococcus equipercicus]